MKVKLKKLLAEQKPAYATIRALLELLDPMMTVQDVDGTRLVGTEAPGTRARIPIEYQEEILGWVSGGAETAVIAQLLGELVAQEAEKRTLALEVLDKYRELNLLYNLSEQLLSVPQPEAIGKIALHEAGRLIQATAGWVVLVNVDSDSADIIAASGMDLAWDPDLDLQREIIYQVVESGMPDMRNQLAEHRYFGGNHFRRFDLLCAPLRTEQRVLGVILLVGASPIVYDAHDLKLLNTMALQVAPAIEMARLYQVAIEMGRMERELQMAHQMQANLIPAETPQVEGWAFAGCWQPARELSGDYYDFLTGNDGMIEIVIADVVDKGIPSALFMVFTRSAVRAAARQRLTPVQLMSQVNNLVSNESNKGLFVTLFYGRLDITTGDFAYVNAGHNAPLLYAKATDELVELTRTGIPLGIDPDLPYEQRMVRIEPGDLIVCYTDGITEAINDQMEEFGVAGLRQVLAASQQASAEQVADTIISAVKSFTGPVIPFDDQALVVVRRL